MIKASQNAWYNGTIGPREKGAPSVASLSFHLGTGVFDGMMAYWNCDHYYVHRAEQHLSRFREGAGRMGLTIPWSIDDMMLGIEELLRLEPGVTRYVRPIAYRGAPELWVTGGEGRPVDVCIFTVEVDRDNDAPMSCHVSSVERISSRAIPGRTKVSGAYVNSLYARRSAEQAGFDDGIMLDRHGRVAEASAANIFIVQGERISTPRLNADVFPGITRLVVIELAKLLGIESDERDWISSELEEVDGIFLCSTLMELRPLSRLGERLVDTQNCTAYRALLEQFRKLTHQ